jgi:hypothetical protein
MEAAALRQFPERYRLFTFKQRPIEAGLANDVLESATHEWIVERNGDGNGCSLRLQLHNSVTAALAHGDESASFKNLAGFGT